MGCIQSASFAVLINGSPSNFFRASRGIRQGCPLSPFLFLLVVDALSRIIEQEKREGSFKGIKVTHSEELSHILFVDDHGDDWRGFMGKPKGRRADAGPIQEIHMNAHQHGKVNSIRKWSVRGGKEQD